MSQENQANEQHWRLLVLMLKNIAKDKGITQVQIAEATGLQQSNVARLFSLKYCPTLNNFIAIAQAIGVNFFFEDKEGDTDLAKVFEQSMEELGRRPDALHKN